MRAIEFLFHIMCTAAFYDVTDISHVVQISESDMVCRVLFGQFAANKNYNFQHVRPALCAERKVKFINLISFFIKLSILDVD